MSKPRYWGDQNMIRTLRSRYSNMIKRCTDPNDKFYADYGGRGITVCNEWTGKNGFANFAIWAIASGFDEHLQIDRIDNNMGYSPDNCRWASPTVNANNKRRTRLLTINGVTKPRAIWAREAGISYVTIRRWCMRYGDEEAVNRLKECLEGTYSSERYYLKNKRSGHMFEIVEVETGKHYPSLRLCAAEKGVHPGSISSALRHGHRCCGYHYEYAR